MLFKFSYIHISIPAIEETRYKSEAVIEGSEMTQGEENQGPITETSTFSLPTEVEEQENDSSEEEPSECSCCCCFCRCYV